MNKRHYEHTLPNIRGSLSNTYDKSGLRVAFVLLITVLLHHLYFYTLLVLFYRIQKCFGRFECRDIVSGNFNCRILRNVPGLSLIHI